MISDRDSAESLRDQPQVTPASAGALQSADQLDQLLLT